MVATNKNIPPVVLWSVEDGRVIDNNHELPQFVASRHSQGNVAVIGSQQYRAVVFDRGSFTSNTRTNYFGTTQDPHESRIYAEPETYSSEHGADAELDPFIAISRPTNFPLVAASTRNQDIYWQNVDLPNSLKRLQIYKASALSPAEGAAIVVSTDGAQLAYMASTGEITMWKLGEGSGDSPKWSNVETGQGGSTQWSTSQGGSGRRASIGGRRRSGIRN